MKNDSFVEIEVCERISDFYIDLAGKKQPKYHAQIKGKPGIWGCGRSVDAAIGDLIQSHQEDFHVQVAFLGRMNR